MKARPLGNYCAVQPLDEQPGSSSSIILTNTHTVSAHVLFAKVLKVGKCVEAVSEGDLVVYEAQSGHPEQWEPIDAAVFGGEEGKDAFLIPCHKKTIGSSSTDMQELLDRKARVQPLIEIVRKGGGDKEMKREIRLHTQEINRIMDKQAKSGRNMNAFERRIEDPGKGRGILAVYEGVLS